MQFTGVMLVGALVWLPGGRPHGTRCANTVVTQYVATLPRTAIIAGDRVILTPPESDELHCLDAQSGKLQWKQRRGDSLIAGCADGGNVLLVAIDDVQGLRLADGTAAWEKQPLPAEALPAGLAPSEATPRSISALAFSKDDAAIDIAGRMRCWA